MESRMSAHEELFELLSSMPEQDAAKMFQRIRSDGRIEEILAHVKNADLLIQLAVVPETNLRYVFPYRSEMPMYLLVSGNPYLNSVVHGALSGLYQSNRNNALGTSNASFDIVRTVQDPYLKPFSAAKLFNPLLSQVSASKWTLVIRMTYYSEFC